MFTDRECFMCGFAISLRSNARKTRRALAAQQLPSRIPITGTAIFKIAQVMIRTFAAGL